jgi:hypothetical protein
VLANIFRSKWIPVVMAEETEEKEKILDKLKTELEIRNFSSRTIKSYMDSAIWTL